MRLTSWCEWLDTSKSQDAAGALTWERQPVVVIYPECCTSLQQLGAMPVNEAAWSIHINMSEVRLLLQPSEGSLAAVTGGHGDSP